ncbi:pyruvate dehydrogenase E2 component (dihydrolipoamide acetyltransferase) [Hoeflea halophila]|uniref:Pyruvate dehydrogenase E2 component (Dihydrolipoamide acetyltransferase) n=1 Tax=Hoeflea halophila TaxID=714899 RepID=A0A286I466_9HYPH|nr:alpha/beta fold hydrolase [Hoeflea halophila]SOE14767.1 pyruvate dehydrogenase E2 component (dihydrolipoamide acetyltransferase) [Hoeflea halophila]
MSGLHIEFSGPEDGIPLVLLHGFGGDGSAWEAVKAGLPDTIRVMAVDLPGHSRSLDADGRGGAGRMAKAILAGLDTAGVASFHLAGHSMGGAVAALIAMRAPERVKTLTLVAPGGMAKEINAGLLARYAKASSEAEIRGCLEEMSAPGFVTSQEVIDHFVAARARPGQAEALEETYQAMFPNGAEEGQGVLPADALAGLPMPVFVIWGTADTVLPCPNPSALPASFAFSVLPNLGHMLPEESPDAIIRVLGQALTSES